MQKDYIMRIVEQFAQAILGIISRRQAGQYQEARKQIHTTARHLLRMKIDSLHFLSLAQVLDLFRDFTNRLDTEKCVLCADLLRQLACVEEAENHKEIAQRLKVYSLYLYTTALPEESQFQTLQYFENVKALSKELENHTLPQEVQSSLKKYNLFHSQRSENK